MIKIKVLYPPTEIGQEIQEINVSRVPIEDEGIWVNEDDGTYFVLSVIHHAMKKRNDIAATLYLK